ncbi:uncharacterized protein LOC121862050 [Homarus americanus]|uniref:uncharacterized protein LOC121862050 n=1 Tax=Homarus americanus TaxID=6706 RepID=UPI001C47244C|nr:uncharacterized protein LOC121862050 [Homarus americanus]
MTAATVIKCLRQLFSIVGIPAYVHSDQGTSFMSRELRNFLTSYGVSTSRTTPYNPRGNGQCEHHNGIIWKTITLDLRSKNIAETNWESVLPDALHSIRSLLCTATNKTPHEKLLSFQRRSDRGSSMLTWLSSHRPVLLRRHGRNSKYDPLVDEVELLEANPQYTHIRFPDGRQSTGVEIRNQVIHTDTNGRVVDIFSTNGTIVDEDEEAERSHSSELEKRRRKCKASLYIMD